MSEVESMRSQENAAINMAVGHTPQLEINPAVAQAAHDTLSASTSTPQFNAAEANAVLQNVTQSPVGTVADPNNTNLQSKIHLANPV
ncbi:MAG: hypothetical protein MRY21_00475 [Simkaniaceae bacterium]|nr:hypothetical protein [Simkaniaceae bacterium]